MSNLDDLNYSTYDQKTVMKITVFDVHENIGLSSSVLSVIVFCFSNLFWNMYYWTLTLNFYPKHLRISTPPVSWVISFGLCPTLQRRTQTPWSNQYYIPYVKSLILFYSNPDPVYPGTHGRTLLRLQTLCHSTNQ